MQSSREDNVATKMNPPMNIHVKARPETTGIEWDVDFKGPPAKGKVTIDLPPQSGDHDIVFHLVATEGLDIDFDTGDPIWVSETQQCPPQSGINSTQISIKDAKKNKLTINDANSGDPVTLTYQLNFVGAPPCDPVIRNGGGGGGGLAISSLSPVTVAVAAVGLLAVGLVVLRLL